MTCVGKLDHILKEIDSWVSAIINFLHVTRSKVFQRYRKNTTKRIACKAYTLTSARNLWLMIASSSSTLWLLFYSLSLFFFFFFFKFCLICLFVSILHSVCGRLDLFSTGSNNESTNGCFSQPFNEPIHTNNQRMNALVNRLMNRFQQLINE